MALFPRFAPPTVEHISGWVSFQDEEVQLAQEEAELEAKWNEIRGSNENTLPLGTSSVSNQEEFESEEPAEGEEDEAEQIEDGASEGGDFGEDEL